MHPPTSNPDRVVVFSAVLDRRHRLGSQVDLEAILPPTHGSELVFPQSASSVALRRTPVRHLTMPTSPPQCAVSLSSQLSIGDIAIAARLVRLNGGSLRGIPTTVVDEYPLLSALIERVYAEPKIAAYNAKLAGNTTKIQ